MHISPHDLLISSQVSCTTTCLPFYAFVCLIIFVITGTLTSHFTLLSQSISYIILTYLPDIPTYCFCQLPIGSHPELASSIRTVVVLHGRQSCYMDGSHATALVLSGSGSSHLSANHKLHYFANFILLGYALYLVIYPYILVILLITRGDPPNTCR